MSNYFITLSSSFTHTTHIYQYLYQLSITIPHIHFHYFIMILPNKITNLLTLHWLKDDTLFHSFLTNINYIPFPYQGPPSNIYQESNFTSLDSIFSAYLFPKSILHIYQEFQEDELKSLIKKKKLTLNNHFFIKCKNKETQRIILSLYDKEYQYEPDDFQKLIYLSESKIKKHILNFLLDEEQYYEYLLQEPFEKEIDEKIQFQVQDKQVTNLFDNLLNKLPKCSDMQYQLQVLLQSVRLFHLVKGLNEIRLIFFKKLISHYCFSYEGGLVGILLGYVKRNFNKLIPNIQDEFGQCLLILLMAYEQYINVKSSRDEKSLYLAQRLVMRLDKENKEMKFLRKSKLKKQTKDEENIEEGKQELIEQISLKIRQEFYNLEKTYLLLLRFRSLLYKVEVNDDKQKNKILSNLICIGSMEIIKTKWQKGSQINNGLFNKIILLWSDCLGLLGVVEQPENIEIDDEINVSYQTDSVQILNQIKKTLNQRKYHLNIMLTWVHYCLNQNMAASKVQDRTYYKNELAYIKEFVTVENFNIESKGSLNNYLIQLLEQWLFSSSHQTELQFSMAMLLIFCNSINYYKTLIALIIFHFFNYSTNQQMTKDMFNNIWTFLQGNNLFEKILLGTFKLLKKWADETELLHEYKTFKQNYSRITFDYSLISSLNKKFLNYKDHIYYGYTTITETIFKQNYGKDIIQEIHDYHNVILDSYCQLKEDYKSINLKYALKQLQFNEYLIEEVNAEHSISDNKYQVEELAFINNLDHFTTPISKDLIGIDFDTLILNAKTINVNNLSFLNTIIFNLVVYISNYANEFHNSMSLIDKQEEVLQLFNFVKMSLSSSWVDESYEHNYTKHLCLSIIQDLEALFKILGYKMSSFLMDISNNKSLNPLSKNYILNVKSSGRQRSLKEIQKQTKKLKMLELIQGLRIDQRLSQISKIQARTKLIIMKVYLYLYRLLGNSFDDMNQFIYEQKLQIVQYCCQQQLYNETLQYIDDIQDQLLIAQIYRNLGNWAKAINIVKSIHYPVGKNLSIMKDQILNPDHFQIFLKYLEYVHDSEFYQPLFLQKFVEQLISIYNSSSILRQNLNNTPILGDFFYFAARNSELCEEYRLALTMLCECILASDSYIQQSFSKIFRFWFNEQVVIKDQRMILDNFFSQVAPYKLVFAIELLITGIEVFASDDISSNLILDALKKLVLAYPDQMVYWICPLKKGIQDKYDKTKSLIKNQAYDKILARITTTNPNIVKKFTILQEQFFTILDIALISINPKYSPNGGWAKLTSPHQSFQLYNQKSEKLLYPNIPNLLPTLKNQQEHGSPFNEIPLFITQISNNISIAPSKDRPRKITVTCSNGQIKYIILKQEHQGDTRRDQRTIQLLHFLNTLIHPFQYPVFATLSMNRIVQIVEWVDETTTLKSLIVKEDYPCRSGLLYSDQEWLKLQRIPPKLPQIFFDFYKTSDEWFEAVHQFTQTMAIWSAFSYLMGLGDRHLDNILIEPKTGKLIHIDFECLFNHGKSLPVPEVVDFRLTKNLRYGMGYLLEQGLFKQYLIEILQKFVQNKQALLGYLEQFIYDPVQSKISEKEVLAFLDKRLRLKNVGEEVDQLIKKNTDIDTLKLMYCGWSPHQ